MLVLAASTCVLEAGSTPIEAQHDMGRMNESGILFPLGLSPSRLGSGTSWLPDSSTVPMYRVSVAGWNVMVHGSMFVQYDTQTTVHGGKQFGVSDWEMATAIHRLGSGVLTTTLGTSLESLIDGPRGYPEILQTGGAFLGSRIANREHPHSPLMQLSASIDETLMPGLAVQTYAAAVGEPAIGPVAFDHRPSDGNDPFAPLAHHWEDATHGENGVVTAGLYTTRVKLEASAFNARESDTGAGLPDYADARLDSYSGRVSVAAGGRVTVAAWAGYLFDHDPLDPNTGMQRYGASVLGSMNGLAGGSWSSAFVWGLDVHHHGTRAHVHDPTTPEPPHHLGSSALLESTLELGGKTAVFGRVEQVQTTADDLGFLGGDLTQSFTIRELSIGATRDVLSSSRGRVGLGVRGLVTRVPESLRIAYGTLTPLGGAVYLSLQPPR